MKKIEPFHFSVRSPLSPIFCYFLCLGLNWMKIPQHTHDIPRNYSFFSQCVSWLFKYLGGKEHRRKKGEELFYFLLCLRDFFVSFIIRIALRAKKELRGPLVDIFASRRKKKGGKKIKKQMIGLIILFLIESISSFELLMTLNCEE